jgi:fatty acid desaturase
MKHAEYVRVLKPLLPPEAFQLAPRRLLLTGLHVAVVLAAWVGVRFVPWYLCPVLALVAGHSVACLGMIAHELSHGAILRNAVLVPGLEAFLWALGCIPATLWRKLHNQSHHVQPNAPTDPDRRFVWREQSVTTWLYTLLFYPNKVLPYNPLSLAHFTIHILHHAVAVFMPGNARPPVSTFKPRYTPADRWRIAFEISLIVAVQLGVFFLAGDGLRWFWAGPVTIFVASGVMMTYIYTNHYLNALGDGSDPVGATTSIIVPEFFNKIHFNFSYHTEHHVFPSMNSDYYPQLSALLSKHFPDRYNRISFGQAWARLSRIEYFVDEPGAEPVMGPGV